MGGGNKHICCGALTLRTLSNLVKRSASWPSTVVRELRRPFSSRSNRLSRASSMSRRSAKGGGGGVGVGREGGGVVGGRGGMRGEVGAALPDTVAPQDCRALYPEAWPGWIRRGRTRSRRYSCPPAGPTSAD